MTYLVTGAAGQLGKVVVAKLQALGQPVQAYTSAELDITKLAHVAAKITKEITCVINCAAYTNVAQSELNPKLAYNVNSYGARNLAVICRLHDIKLVHISTDYVFDGTRQTGYVESHSTRPLNVYGKSKLAGEEWLHKLLPEHVIVRTSWLYGIDGHNFVKSILKKAKAGEELAIVTDQIGSPTYAAHLADLILQLIEQDLQGTFHAAGGGSCSWYDFASKILELANLSQDIKAITSDELEQKVTRPIYSQLLTERLPEQLQLPHWTYGLKDFIALYQEEIVW